MATFKFERLAVWQKALEYADAVYSCTEDFPTRENFGLSSQLRRAAVSVSSNIAEGNSRTSKADYARFIEIAYGSLRRRSRNSISQSDGVSWPRVVSNNLPGWQLRSPEC